MRLEAQNTKSNIADFFKVLNGVVTRSDKKSPSCGLKSAYIFRYSGFCKSSAFQSEVGDFGRATESEREPRTVSGVDVAD